MQQPINEEPDNMVGPDGNQEDYYSNFARRVYYLAEEEGWDRQKVMGYFNDKQSFEKFYNNVSCLLQLLGRSDHAVSDDFFRKCT